MNTQPGEVIDDLAQKLNALAIEHAQLLLVYRKATERIQIQETLILELVMEPGHGGCGEPYRWRLKDLADHVEHYLLDSERTEQDLADLLHNARTLGALATAGIRT